MDTSVLLTLINFYEQRSLPLVLPRTFPDTRSVMVSRIYLFWTYFILILCLFFLAFTTDEIRKLGVDDVYCLSVNDAFVMRQVQHSRELLDSIILVI